MAPTKKRTIGQINDVDLRLLRVFVAITRAGGLTGAELELNIDRSTISRHLKDLETRLGLTLCHRGRSGFALTREGESVLAGALQLFGSIDNFTANAEELHQNLRGTIAIAMFDKALTNPTAQIPEAFQRLDQAAPEVKLDIYIEPTNRIENGVLEGRFHVGIIPTHRYTNSLTYEPIYREQMYLYCGRDHPLFERTDRRVTSQDIRKCKYAGIGFHSPNMEASNRFRLKRAADVHDQEALAALVLCGRYVGFLPDHYAQIFVERGLMRPLLQDEIQYRCDFAAITRTEPRPARHVRKFLECLKEAHVDNRMNSRA